MEFTTKTQDQIRDDILRDIKNLLPDANIGVDSDYYIRAAAKASATEGLYQHQEWIVRQLFPDVADAEYMEIHANLHNVTRKPATYATGSLKFTGTPTSAIPLGTEAKTAAGVAYVTTIAGALDGTGNATIAAQAVLPGIGGNTALNTAVTLTAAPSGVDGSSLTTDMLAGTDTETDASLLERLLFILRNPPSSGSKADYKRWAKEVAGCDDAFVYPLRRGLGTTDVFIISGGGLPSLQLINDVTDNINDQRPCGVNTLEVLAPTLLPVNHTIEVKVSGITLAEATGLVNGVLDSYFDTLLPGDTYILSQVEAMISNIVGITDRNVTAPAANVVPLANSGAVEWCRKGAVNVSLMP